MTLTTIRSTPRDSWRKRRNRLAVASVIGGVTLAFAAAAPAAAEGWVSQTVTPDYTATFGAQSPNPAPPSTPLSTTVLSTTVTFTRTAPSSVNIGVDLDGTAGEGTLTNPSIDSGGDCVATSDRGFRCDWLSNDPSPATVTFDVNVGAGATPPDWTLRAILDEQGIRTTLATRSVVIEPPPTTTSTTTTTTTTTTTAAPTTTAPTTTAAPTTIAPTTAAPTTIDGGAATTVTPPGGELPATGPSAAMTSAMIGVALLGGGFVFMLLARRRIQRPSTDSAQTTYRL